MAGSKGKLRNSMRVKEESEKESFKLKIQKLRSWNPDPSPHANRWGKNGKSDRFYFGGLQKSLQSVTAAMELRQLLEKGYEKHLVQFSHTVMSDSATPRTAAC